MILFLGCTTPPKKFHEVSKGTWKADVVVKDKKLGKKVMLNAKFKANYGKHLRLDVTSPLGAHVASLVVNDGSVEYMLIKERRFYYGKTNESSLNPIFSLPLNPEWLYSVLFDRTIRDKNWNCIKDESFIRECLNLKTNMKVTWLNRRGKKKAVLIDHKAAELQLSFTNFDASIENEENAFNLKVPKSFKKVKL